MGELGLQIDGHYAVCFKNFKNISEEETRSIFQKYGNVHSIRQSSESVPWVFIRYKLQEEAQKALDDLQGYKDFEIQVAKSFAKKKQDLDGDRMKGDNCMERGKGDNFSDRVKGDNFMEYSRDNRSNKGPQNRNRGSEKFTMDDGDNDSFDAKGSYKKGPYINALGNNNAFLVGDIDEDLSGMPLGVHRLSMACENVDHGKPDPVPYQRSLHQDNRKQNNFAERPNRNREGENFNHKDQVNDTEGARALPTFEEGPYTKNYRSQGGKYDVGRERYVSEREYEESGRIIDNSPPRLVKKTTGKRIVSGAVEIEKNSDDDGPPKLVKGSEYYANSMEESTTRSLALRAAHDEVWKNHPLHSERKLREVILTNFDQLPSRKDIYELCSPVKPLHVSFGETLSKSRFCRVLVSSETDVNKLHMLNSEELLVTTLEEVLDSLFINESED